MACLDCRAGSFMKTAEGTVDEAMYSWMMASRQLRYPPPPRRLIIDINYEICRCYNLSPEVLMC